MHSALTTDNARYLFIRLSLRKTDRWFPLSDLKYQKELGEQGIQKAIKELCGNPTQTSDRTALGEDLPQTDDAREPEIIALTGDEGDGTSTPIETGDDPEPPAGLDPLAGVVLGSPDYSLFAWDAARADLFDLLNCLKTADLRKFLQRMRLKPKESTVSYHFPSA